MRPPFLALAIAAVLSGRLSCPEPVSAASAGHCGFERAREATRSAASALLRPSPGPQFIDSPHFRVHYNLTAGQAVFAQDVSDASELAYRVLVDTIAHVVPPADGVEGGDGRIDVYVRTTAQLGGDIYGRTVLENIVGTPYPNSSTSWVEIVDTLGVQRRRIVAAHEAYHVVQVGYDRDESVSMLEMLSTWIEDRAYDYHLNLATLQLFFRWPWRGLFSQTYTNSPWAIYLAEKYGDGILREALEHAGAQPGSNPRSAFDGALVAVAGTTFHDEFIEFGTYNYFTGARDDGAHYAEGSIYREVTCEKRSDCCPFPLHISRQAPAELGTNYFFFDGDGSTDALRLRVVPDFYATSLLSVTRFKGPARTRTTTTYLPLSPEDTLTIHDWGECDSLLAVYQIEFGAGTNSFALAADYVRAPAPAGDWVLVLDRDGCRAPFDGVGDEFTARDGEEAPIAEALRANGATVVVSDSIPTALAGCVGVFVVGGFDQEVVTLSDGMLATLTAYIDAGGDVYLEGSRLGGLLAAGNATQQAFWGRFGASFAPGAETGNVSTWNTAGGALVGEHTFDYDPGSPDSLVGILTAAGATILARDGTGTARATAYTVGPSARLVSTVLLGGSNGSGGSTRAGYANDVMTLFGINLATLSVSRARLSIDGHDVVIDGVLEHYDGEDLSLARLESAQQAPVALELARVGGEWRFRARDRIPGNSVLYRLTDETHTRVLWEERAVAATPPLALRLERVYPNPARDDVRLVLDANEASRASIGVYDVAGRRVALESADLTAGRNVIFLRTRFDSGHYFVRVDTGTRRAHGRFSVIR